MTISTSEVPKEPVQKLHEALAHWRSQQSPPSGESPSTVLLQNILIEKGHRLYELLAEALSKDSTTTRIYLKDLLGTKEEFADLWVFLQLPKPGRYLDTLRGWLRDRFGSQIRVEGDPRYAGYYFEFV